MKDEERNLEHHCEREHSARTPKLKWPVCINLLGINGLEKSYQTQEGMLRFFLTVSAPTS